jgi:5'-3' exonuclease
MGIKSLNKFLKSAFPDLFELIHISEYQFKKIAIDTSLYLCSYKALYQERWLSAFVKLISVLRENEIHCVFIYDTGAPVEKQKERQRRAENRDRLQERIQIIEYAVEKYENEGVIDDVLIKFQEKRKIDVSKLIRVNNVININGIKQALEKMKNQAFQVSKEDFELTKKLFDVLQVPYFNAPMEAENMCSDLCIQGKVDAVLSEDSDVLAYGAPVFLTKINTKESTCFRINYEKLLKYTEFTKEQFTDFCIMCGSDYNENIPKIGPSKAYKLLKENSTIDNLENKGYDISVLNHKRVRNLFLDYEKSQVKIPYCGIPNFTDVQIFITKKNLAVNVDNLKKSFVREFVIQEEEKE